MLTCKTCGEFLTGDGVEEPIRCPNIPEEVWSQENPETADFLYCEETESV